MQSILYEGAARMAASFETVRYLAIAEFSLVDQGKSLWPRAWHLASDVSAHVSLTLLPTAFHKLLRTSSI
jgi:hypothetical protein